MAISWGGRLSVSRQRAKSQSSAVESGPPETASSNAGKDCRSENNDLASVTEIISSAVDTLLFLCDAALHARRGARKFAPDFGQRGAGRFLLIERGQRLAETQQGVGRLAGFLVFGRHRQERFRGVAIALALEQAFAP